MGFRLSQKIKAIVLSQSTAVTTQKRKRKSANNLIALVDSAPPGHGTVQECGVGGLVAGKFNVQCGEISEMTCLVSLLDQYLSEARQGANHFSQSFFLAGLVCAVAEAPRPGLSLFRRYIDSIHYIN